MRLAIPFFILLILLAGCSGTDKKQVTLEQRETIQPVTQPSLIILGTVQDAGSPHIGCTKDCCKKLFENPDPSRKVVSLGVIDPENDKTLLFEATPDFTTQVHALNQFGGRIGNPMPDGIFLTHAHIGHYTGLMYLGKESTHASEVPVYAMPRMKAFLEHNGPWSQLVELKNIALQPLMDQALITPTPDINVTPLIVPHRDEYSETVGYIIAGPGKSALFIPDIDKWERWEIQIEDMIAQVDYAFLDATFYDASEVGNRDISEIPHPFIVESMERFSGLPATEKEKIYFIHLNHTNPALDTMSAAYQTIMDEGFKVAKIHTVLSL